MASTEGFEADKRYNLIMCLKDDTGSYMEHRAEMGQLGGCNPSERWW